MKTILILATTVMLLLCLAPMPYGYFQLVRFVVMIIFMVFSYNYFRNAQYSLAIVFGALALLFQPFLKIALGRVMWNIVDVLVALGLIMLFFYERKNEKEF